MKQTKEALNNKMENGIYKEFSKDMLKVNDVCELRGGARYMINIFEGVMFGQSYGSLYSSPKQDLTHDCFKELDVVKVYRPTQQRQFFEKSWGDMPCIWERKEEPVVKELTMAELEEELGYKVKVVK